MAANGHFRASDADRDKAAALLREHHAAGRLDADEFSERLAAAFAARTLGDLDELMADLPPADIYPLPDAQLRRSGQGGPPRPGRSAQWGAGAGSLLTLSLMCVVLWGLTGRAYLWPLWLTVVILAGRLASRTGPQGRESQAPPGGRAGGPARERGRAVTRREVPAEVAALLRGGSRLDAVARYRQLTGASLAEAMAVIGRLEDESRPGDTG